jgi:hypothetical protein
MPVMGGKMIVSMGHHLNFVAGGCQCSSTILLGSYATVLPTAYFTLGVRLVYSESDTLWKLSAYSMNNAWLYEHFLYLRNNVGP